MKELFQNKGSVQTLSVCFKCVLPATRGAFLVLQESLRKGWGFKYPQKAPGCSSAKESDVNL